jgi:hypothetical protein
MRNEALMFEKDLWLLTMGIACHYLISSLAFEMGRASTSLTALASSANSCPPPHLHGNRSRRDGVGVLQNAGQSDQQTRRLAMDFFG